MQIIVLGSHRSGTSLITRLINMMGAYFDAGTTSIGFNDENPKGFWERRDVIACNDALLQAQGCTWEHLAAWKLTSKPAKKQLTDAKATIEQMKNIVLELDAHRPWVMKDPRLCVTFPFWKPLLEMPVAVVVYRDPLEVAMSLKTRNHFRLAHGIAIWEYSMAGIVNSIQGMPTIFVRHDEIISKPIETVKRVYDALCGFDVRNLQMPSDKEILSFIEPSLYRSRWDDVDRKSILTAPQLALVDYITQAAPLPTQDINVSILAQQAMEEAAKLALKEQRTSQQYQQFAELEHQHTIALNDLAHAQQRIADLERLVLDEKVHAAEMNKQLDDLHASKSWKIMQTLGKILHPLR